MNSITLTGRLVRDPELRQTPSGVSVCNFTIAVDRSYSKEEKQADFMDYVAWRGIGEFVSKYFQKGKMIAVRGEMQSRKYVDKNGNNRVAWEVLVDRAEFCGSKSDGQTAPEVVIPTVPSQTAPVQTAPAAQTTPAQTTAEQIGDLFEDDLLPF